MHFGKLITCGLILAATSFAATIPRGGVTLFIGGVDETSLLRLPSVVSGRNSFGFTNPVTIPGLAIVRSLQFSSFDDPFINFAGAVENTTVAPQTFTFTFFNPYIDGPYTILRDSFSDSFTDGNGNGTVTVGLAAGATSISQPQVDASLRDGQGVPCTVVGGSGFSGACNPGASPVNFAIPATPASGTFGTTVSFMLSPGDLYSFNGRVELLNTPEPATWAMMIMGVGMVAFGTIRKYRAASR